MGALQTGSAKLDTAKDNTVDAASIIPTPLYNNVVPCPSRSGDDQLYNGYRHSGRGADILELKIEEW
jgi:hypothetical protein